MKKNYWLIIIFSVIFAAGCASSPTKTPEVKKDTGSVSGLISSQNEQLQNHSIGGFAYKSSKLDNARWDRWAEKAAPIVKEIISKLPEGYALQITGHTDASGPENAEGDKPGNIKISTDRAKTVYDALERAGISSPKITYKGVGTEELLNMYDSKGAQQRRVTFKIVEK
jgi:outer membrane protein OmpA-like peptidoglycan-associated protein